MIIQYGEQQSQLFPSVTVSCRIFLHGEDNYDLYTYQTDNKANNTEVFDLLLLGLINDFHQMKILDLIVEPIGLLHINVIALWWSHITLLTTYIQNKDHCLLGKCVCLMTTKRLSAECKIPFLIRTSSIQVTNLLMIQFRLDYQTSFVMVVMCLGEPI